jgi:hypothetical protein
MNLWKSKGFGRLIGAFAASLMAPMLHAQTPGVSNNEIVIGHFAPLSGP